MVDHVTSALKASWSSPGASPGELEVTAEPCRLTEGSPQKVVCLCIMRVQVCVICLRVCNMYIYIFT